MRRQESVNVAQIIFLLGSVTVDGLCAFVSFGEGVLESAPGLYDGLQEFLTTNVNFGLIY